jgi:hypothetical protein
MLACSFNKKPVTVEYNGPVNQGFTLTYSDPSKYQGLYSENCRNFA